jgi:hypothetical protein
MYSDRDLQSCHGGMPTASGDDGGCSGDVSWDQGGGEKVCGTPPIFGAEGDAVRTEFERIAVVGRLACTGVFLLLGHLLRFAPR